MPSEFLKLTIRITLITVDINLLSLSFDTQVVRILALETLGTLAMSEKLTYH